MDTDITIGHKNTYQFLTGRFEGLADFLQNIKRIEKHKNRYNNRA